MRQQRIKVDGVGVAVPRAATLLDAARIAGIHIPTLCHLDGVEPYTSCMVCVVRDETSGALVPACSTLAQDGMEVSTRGQEVEAARRAALELLLGEHAGECLAPCRRACPAGLDAPMLMARLAEGDLNGAAELARESLVLPASLGLVCVAGCERVCRRKGLDSPLPIRDLHRLVAEQALAVGSTSGIPRAAQGADVLTLIRPVVVVGAGPAGLAAARELASQGMRCVLYEAQSRAGGSLRGRVPEPLLEAEIAVILGDGVELRAGVRAGDDIEWSEVIAESAAVLLATGSSGVSPREVVEALGPGQGGLEPRILPAGAVAGSCKLAVQAVARGRAAALTLAGLLLGPKDERGGADRVKAPGSFSTRLPRLDRSELEQRSPNAAREPGLEAPRDLLQAAVEARRCLGCGCVAAATCRLRRLSEDQQVDARRFAAAVAVRPTPRVDLGPLTHDPGLCIHCGLCVRVAEAADEPAGPCFIGRGSNTRIGAPLGEPGVVLSDEVADRCARACPTGALLRTATDRGEVKSTILAECEPLPHHSEAGRVHHLVSEVDR